MVVLAIAAGCVTHTDSKVGSVRPDTLRSMQVEVRKDSIQSSSIQVARIDTLMPATGLQMALVDRAANGDPGDVAFVVGRVQVKYAGRTDTIPKVLTNRLPVAGDDGKLYVFGYDDSGILDKGYAYDPQTRTLSEFEAPPGSTILETHILLSPDAKHIAYIATEGNARGVVRSWPDGALVAEGPISPWCEGDEDYNSVRWLDLQTAELAYCSGGSRRIWVHTLVDVVKHQIKVDTLTSYPRWQP